MVACIEGFIDQRGHLLAQNIENAEFDIFNIRGNGPLSNIFSLIQGKYISSFPYSKEIYESTIQNNHKRLSPDGSIQRRTSTRFEGAVEIRQNHLADGATTKR